MNNGIQDFAKVMEQRLWLTGDKIVAGDLHDANIKIQKKISELIMGMAMRNPKSSVMDTAADIANLCLLLVSKE